jgi:DNA-binding winged helix-turn-helix (wHTH) protein
MSNENNYLYEFGPFILNSKLEFLQCNGKAVKLPPKAIEVLIVLVQRRGELIPKQELVRAVWGEQTLVEEGNLTLRIYQIRKVLGTDSSGQKYIETFSRKGYSFVARVRVIKDSSAEEIEQEYMKLSGGAESKQAGNPLNSLIEKEISEQNTLLSALHMRLSKAAVIRAVVIMIIIAVASTIAFIWYSGESNGKPQIVINSDGSWTATVLPIAEGIKLETDVQKFELSAGDTIEAITTGEVDIGRIPVGPDGEPVYEDLSMDSPFKDHVGGLEMWIGPNKTLNRYFIGSRFNGEVNHSGVPTFRVIESWHGYKDGNNSGSFQVTIKKIPNSQER